MSIEAVEDFVIDKTKAMFGNKLRVVDVLPSALNLGLLKQIIPTAPAVYVTFLGGRPSNKADTDGPRINARFDVYIITRHVGNDQARRRGDSTTLGAYQIMRMLVPQLHEDVVDDVGQLMLANVQNLFSLQPEEAFKAAMYAVTFEVPGLAFPFEVDMAVLDDFETFAADYDTVPHESAQEHEKWLQEPPDYTESQPDAQDKLTDLNQ